jgi:ATP-binding cassette subfamily F protein uup
VATEVLALDGHGGHGYYSDYSQWERARRAAAAARAPKPPAKNPTTAAPRRLSTAEQRELSRIEGKIEAAEAELERLKERLNDPEVATDHVKIQECWAQVQQAEERVAALYARWEELEALKASLQSG